MDKKRAVNLAPADRKLLISVIAIHAEILERKKTDGATCTLKNKEWMLVEEEFNANGSLPRDWRTLKRAWENMKKKARALALEGDKNINGTGGGPCKKINLEGDMGEVLAIIRPEYMGSTYDYDSPVEIETVLNPSEIKVEPLESSEEPLTTDPHEPHSAILLNGNWNNYSVSQLASSKCSILQTNPAGVFPEDPLKTFGDETQKNSDDLRIKIDKTPKKVTISRRRPIVKRTDGENLTRLKLHSLQRTEDRADLEYEKKMEIMEVQLAIEKEKLKQERLKTRLLLNDLRNRKRNSNSL